ncbi:hypothetical protein ACVU7I_15795, partial [Patulibacter sp. S7RM1-6]
PPAGAWTQPPAAAPKRRGGGCLGRMVRNLVILLVLLAVIGGGVYYVTMNEVAPRLRDVAGDTVRDVGGKLDQLIQDNTK